MARRRHDKPITVWLSTATVDALDSAVADLGDRRANVLRRLITAFIEGSNVAPNIWHELRLVREDLRRIGVNLNQAMRLANTYRRPVPALARQARITSRAVAKAIGILDRLEVCT